MGMEPAFARRPFTVLFAMPVLRHEVLRRQGNNLWLPGADDHRRDGSMIIECVAIAELTAQTVGTMNGLGRKVVSAIEGHEQLIAQDAKMGQHPMVFKAFKDLHIAPCGRTLQPSPHTQGPARCTLEAYVPRLITSPSS